MTSAMKIAVLLTAVDGMSGAVDAAVGKSLNSLRKMELGAKAALSFETGKKGFEAINETVKASADLEEASNKLKAVMLGSDGLYSQDMLNKIENQSQLLSEKYANNATAYIDMFRILKTNRINPEDALGGIGESVAQLADYFDRMNPGTIAEFAARMRNDMGISVKDMGQMMDMIARVKDAGVGKTGAEAVEEMNQFFSKVGLGMANLHVQGVQAGKEMSALGALFMNRGLSGQTVGTNFRRIFDGLRDPGRMSKVNAIADSYGKHLEFFDKEHKFLGIQSFVTELGKLQGLKPDAIAAILSPFSGKQGLSTDFLEFLANDGTKGMNELNAKIANQATLTEKLSKVMDGLNYMTDVFKTSWQNVKAQLGSGLLPLFKDIFHWLNKIAVGIREFAAAHPTITKTIMYIGLFVSILFLLAGVIMTAKLSWGFLMVGLESMRVLLFPIISFLQKMAFVIFYELLPALWQMATANLAATWEFAIIAVAIIAVIAAIVGLIYYWDEVNAIMNGLFSVIKPLGEAFVGLGKIIAGAFTFNPKMMMDGIRDIHSTIDLYKRNTLVDLFANGTAASMQASIAKREQENNGKPVPVAGAGIMQQAQNLISGGMPVFAPVINLTGGATQGQADMVSATVQKTLDQWWRDKQHQINRTGFK